MEKAFQNILLCCAGLGFVLLYAGCSPGGVGLLADLGDADGDHWYDSLTNQRVDLFIDEILTIGGGGGEPGPMTVIVDDRIMTNYAGGSPGLDTPVSSRFVGTWLLEGGDAPKNFISRVKIFSGDPGWSNDKVPTEIRWHNRDTTWEVSVPGAGRVTFRSVITKFADPNPTDPHADSDGDGITEREEALLAGDRNRLGNILAPDIAVAVVHTASEFSLRPYQREALTTTFMNNDFNLQIIDDNNITKAGIRGGKIAGVSKDTLFSVTTATGVRQTTSLRPQIIDARFDSLVFLAVLQKEMHTADGVPYGRATGIPGLGFVMRSAEGIIGRDLYDYQAKVFMHELGHCLGLCHPVTGTAPCVPLPAAEATNSATVMGTPADDPGPIEAIATALGRPLNYSPTQWTGLLLTTARLGPR